MAPAGAPEATFTKVRHAAGNCATVSETQMGRMPARTDRSTTAFTRARSKGASSQISTTSTGASGLKSSVSPVVKSGAAPMIDFSGSMGPSTNFLRLPSVLPAARASISSSSADSTVTPLTALSARWVAEMIDWGEPACGSHLIQLKSRDRCGDTIAAIATSTGE